MYGAVLNVQHRGEKSGESRARIRLSECSTESGNCMYGFGEIGTFVVPALSLPTLLFFSIQMPGDNCTLSGHARAPLLCPPVWFILWLDLGKLVKASRQQVNQYFRQQTAMHPAMPTKGTTQ